MYLCINKLVSNHLTSFTYTSFIKALPDLTFTNVSSITGGSPVTSFDSVEQHSHCLVRGRWCLEFLLVVLRDCGCCDVHFRYWFWVIGQWGQKIATWRGEAGNEGMFSFAENSNQFFKAAWYPLLVDAARRLSNNYVRSAFIVVGGWETMSLL